MIEHIIITVLICFTVLVVNSQITSALQARWKRQADDLEIQRRRNARKIDLDNEEQ